MKTVWLMTRISKRIHIAQLKLIADQILYLTNLYISLNFWRRLKEIQHLKEEIEHVDVNLIRFNVKKESELFISRIQAFNNDEPSHTIVKIGEPIVSNKKISSVKKEFSCCLKVI